MTTKLRLIERGQRTLRSLIERQRCVSPQEDVECALAEDRGARAEISPADLREVRAQLLNYALDQLHGDGWRQGIGIR